MPHIIEVTDLAAPELDVYARLTEAQLRNRLEPDKGVFIAESPKVIATALDAGYEPLSLLMERRHIEGDAQPILARCGGIPVYTAERETLARLTGFELTRGVLCAMRRQGSRAWRRSARGRGAWRCSRASWTTRMWGRSSARQPRSASTRCW